MNKGNFNTEIAIMPTGEVYDASEQAIQEHYPMTRENMIGKYVYEQTQPLVAREHNSRIIDTLTTPRYSSTLKRVADGTIGSLQAQAPGVGNAQNLSHIQLIRLYPQIQGKPIEYFYLESLFKTRQIPNLEYRESFYDTVETAEYRQRLEPSRQTRIPYGEIAYNLKKLVDVVYTPVEDMYKTLMDPQQIESGNVKWAMKKRRNEEARKALDKLPEQGGNSSNDITGVGVASGANFHSSTSFANELNEIFTAFIKANDVRIDAVAMSPNSFAIYTSNTWTNAGGPTGVAPKRLPGGGITTLPGLEGIQCVVDTEVPESTIYAINKENALRLGEGPKLLRRYHDEDRSADVIKVSDFHQFIAVDDAMDPKLNRKFGTKIKFAE